MFLQELRLWNFRKFGLKEGTVITNDNPGLCIEFDSGLNVLVGENDSGKSTIIDAIRYVLDTNAAERTFISEYDFHKNEKSLKIALTFNFSEGEDPIKLCSSFTEHLSYEANKPILHVTLQAYVTERTTRGIRFIDRKIKTGINGTGNLLEGEIREFIKATYLRPLRDAQTALSAGRGSRLSQILSGHSGITTDRDNLIKHLLEANKKISGEAVITKTQETINTNYLHKMTFADDTCSASINISDSTDITKLNDRQKDNLLRRILEKLNLDLIEPSKDFQSPHGLGYNNLMFIATELLLLEQEKEANISLLLIEEPEAHLHPQMQLQLLEFIKSKSEIQTILSTHSPNLASKVPTDKLHLLSGCTSFSLKKKETKLDDDDYIFLNKFLDVTKSNLFFARGVLIVEGDAENILLPTIAKLLGRPLEKYGVSIVNVGHTGLFRFSRIFQRKLDNSPHIPIKVGCITDRDLRPAIARFRSIDAAGVKDNPDGYIQETDKNKTTFEDYYDESTPDKRLSTYIDKIKSNDGQNVKTFISPSWTLEHDMALSGLSKEVFEAINNKPDGYDALNTADNVRLSIQIYKPLVTNSSKSKTETAYRLCKILEKKFWDEKENKAKDSDILLAKLPRYIIEALEYVTGKAIIQVPQSGATNV